MKKNNPKALILMAGISGSGKSSIVRALLERMPETAFACSADHYWIQDDGSYKFDITKLDQSHQRCMRNFVEAAAKGLHGELDVIIVDNTHLSLLEQTAYFQVGKAFGLTPMIVMVETDPKVSAGRNVHGMTLERIEAQQRKLGRFESEFERVVHFWPPLMRVKGEDPLGTTIKEVRRVVAELTGVKIPATPKKGVVHPYIQNGLY